jgi:hypothetical protein
MSLNPDFSDKATLEKYSSTTSISDMEIYVFPELLYPLVLANIMSPIIWEWREDPWFKDITRKSFNFKLNRIKQYIMEHYVFNLDLETWGLTTKEKEISRFGSFVNMETIRQSNALFGYEGDKYYFDIDIRRHFGLDSYTSNVIPYWKTETVEAMTAFRFKESFMTGAGECVSLSALYVAALFIVGRIPLEYIFLIGTPLHSQNFIDVNEGALTNNRRIVTKKMWFNGTSMSAKARRALENEKVTLVSHISGYIHQVFDKATIQAVAYQRFSDKLKTFLTADLTPDIFVNFLRYHMNFKKCFQYKHNINGHDYYIALETVFTYEHNSRFSFSEPLRESLLNEIDDEEFSHSPIKDRLVIQDIERSLAESKGASLPELTQKFLNYASAANCSKEESIKSLFSELAVFLHVQPQLPLTQKQFIPGEPLHIHTDQTRQDIMDYLSEKAAENEVALLSLYTYRQMDKIHWKPFIKAAFERNPVSLEGLKGKAVDAAYQSITAMQNNSIYDGNRLAQPDEVWNFGRGDGVEKAILFANYLCNETKPDKLDLFVDNALVILSTGRVEYRFQSSKTIVKHLNLTDQV